MRGGKGNFCIKPKKSTDTARELSVAQGAHFQVQQKFRRKRKDNQHKSMYCGPQAKEE